jgi:hypothetical protein
LERDTALRVVTRHLCARTFERQNLSSSDLVECFANNWHLNPPLSTLLWYKGEATGYLDQPVYQP